MTLMAKTGRPPSSCAGCARLVCPSITRTRCRRLTKRLPPHEPDRAHRRPAPRKSDAHMSAQSARIVAPAPQGVFDITADVGQELTIDGATIGRQSLKDKIRALLKPHAGRLAR